MDKIILFFILMILNVVVTIVNYKAERFGVALLNAFAAGVCFMLVIVAVAEKIA